MKRTRLKLLLATGLTALGLNLTPQSASAATTSGVMTGNETWSGTVTLTGDVTVPNNVTLTILPGTRVACWDKYDDQAGGLNTSRIELIVNQGVLNAVGTSNNPILFTSSPLHPPALAGDWYGIRLKAGTNGVSTLRYCTVEFGNEGLRVEGGQPTIDHCVFKTNSVNGLFLGVYGTIADCSFVGNGNGIAADSSGCKLSRCFVVNNQSDGVNASNLPDGPCVTIEDCQITGNAGIGAKFVRSSTTPSRIYQISNTLIANNLGQAINSVGQLSLVNCVITNNNTGPSAALSVSEYSSVCLIISGCFIENNGGENQVDANYGIRMTNTIVRNARGFDYAGQHHSVFGLQCGNSHSVIVNSMFLGNGGGGMNVGATFDLLGCTVTDNGNAGVTWAGGGIAGGPGGTTTIQGCTIIRNSGAGFFVSGGIGIDYGWHYQLAMSGNIVQGNGIGLLLGSARGTVTGISSNTIAGNDIFEIQNTSSNNIIATNNFWGEPTTSELNNNVRNLTKVYDSQDNASVGQVHLKPYLPTDPFAVPPQITSQPTNLFLPPGTTAAFHVTATGSAPLGYQWQKEGVNLANVGRVSGATSPDLTITSSQASDVGNYRVVVTNTVGAVTSVWARLDLPLPPTITTSPATQVVGVGAPATFSVTATGSTPMNYQWYLNGSVIGGANDASFSIPVTTAAWLGSYQVQVWNSAGTNWSATAGLWLDELKMYAGVNVYGPAGSNCVVQYATNLTAPVTWMPLQSVIIVTNPMVIIDYDSPEQPKRFYRTVPQ